MGTLGWAQEQGCRVSAAGMGDSQRSSSDIYRPVLFKPHLCAHMCMHVLGLQLGSGGGIGGATLTGQDVV